MAVTEAFFIDSSTGWRPRRDTRIKPQNQIFVRNNLIQQDSIIDPDNGEFGLAREEFIREYWTRK